MRDPESLLAERFRSALAEAFGSEHAAVDPAIRRSTHADYQADVAMSLARTLKRKPRDLAQALIDCVKLDDVAEKLEIAGPGFVNVTLSREYLERALEAACLDERVGVPLADRPETVVIDYSSPNVAKEMHVGHIRSTIIGDALARTLEFLGHRVIRQNHLGDWGTPFGMLIEHLLDLGPGAADSGVTDLNAFYKQARQKFDADPAFAERSRKRVVRLQSGDAETLSLWQRLVEESTRHFHELYARLGITLTPGDVRGESFYNALLAGVVTELEQKRLAVENEGATCVFVPGFTNREGAPLPLIVQKQDGGFGYAATDLAGVRFRTRDLGGTRLLYVVGAPQQQHLTMVFEVGKLAGWLEGARAEHVAFGSILGQDKKMFKTRSGETVRLADLLDEAEERALTAVNAKNPDLDPDTRREVAHQVAVGAIKYADLSSDRIKDYVFDFDRMLAFEGNTGPYLMYAHTRCRSILRKAESHGLLLCDGPVPLDAPEERAVAVELLALAAAIRGVEQGLQPHKLCTYLFELATVYSTFFEKCPVIRAETPDRAASRLRLCNLTARTLALGLGLLGIAAPDRM
jgi:arginyl-tRNA synthetase